MKSSDYASKKIEGMCYVRVIKNSRNEDEGYLLIDSTNKPVKNVYHYLKYCMTKKGDSLNTIKRKVYDLCYFCDFMNFNNIDEELMNHDYFFNIIREYLPVLNPNYRVKDCIDRSMLDKIPVLDIYRNKNISVTDKYNAGGINVQTIRKIGNTVKEYLIYLNDERNIDINLDDIFEKKVVRIQSNHMLGKLKNDKIVVYSINNTMKACGVPISKETIMPIDVSKIFQPDEEEVFFETLYGYSKVYYQTLFYLLSITGMRINEALALKVFDIHMNNCKIDFTKWKSDLILQNDKEDIWEIFIVSRPDNPPDLKVKFNKSRKIYLSDKTKKFRSLLNQLVMFRIAMFRKKRKHHEFLFINRTGDRLKYTVSKQHFDATLNKAGLGYRKGQLGPHSFRHTFASTWIQSMKRQKSDVEIEELSRYLGHSTSLITRKVYMHLFKDDLLEILQKMEKSKNQSIGE